MNENLSRYDSNALISTEDGKVGFLNTLSGTFSPLADSPVFTDIALSKENELFGVTFDRLYKIDLNNGKSEVVGNLGSSGFNALDFASDGALYSAKGSGFYTIDTETGATTLIENLGTGFVSSGDLVFDPARKHFWATSQGKDSNLLYEIDLEGKIIGEGKKIGLSDVYGLSLDELGTLFGYTADGQQFIINKETGASTYEQKIDGLNGEIFGATEYRPISSVLFADDFEGDLSKWTGKEGGETFGVIVEDPIEGDRALSFRELNAGGDIFTVDPVESPSGKYRLTFDYLGVEKSGSVPDDLGGFAGYSYSLNPFDDIGNVVENWLAGTQDNYPKYSNVQDQPIEVLLQDTGRWESVSIEFSEEQPIHLSFEDYKLSDGVPEDVYFDNVRLEALPSDEDTPEEPDYLKELAIRGTITGGNSGGNLLDGVDPNFRNVGFREIKAPAGEEVEQTWVVIHGWNSSPDGESIAPLSNALAQKAGENDRVLALDWREAAENALGAFNLGGNGIAATWIASVAEFAVKALQDKYGIDSEKAAESLNLVGHSLGTLVSSEMGRLYKTGQNRSEKDTITGANGEGARTITALDPPSQENLLAQEYGGGYDVDGRLKTRQNPANFDDVSRFSRSFVGRSSLSGNPALADRADEAFELDFNSPVANFEEHGRVVKTFTNIITSDRPGDPPQNIDDLFGIDAYSSLDELPIEQFGVTELNRGDGDRTYQGIINVDENNQPTLLTAKANKDVTGKDFNFLIGGAEQETIKSLVDASSDKERLFGDSNDNIIEGKIGEDTLVGSAGNDTLVSGYGLVKLNSDFLFGGKGADRLDGDGGSDTYVYQAGDGSTDINKSDIIVNFGIGKDAIGLIDLEFEELSFESRDRDTAIKSGDEYLALLKNVKVDTIQNPALFVSLGAEDFQIT